jgi:hypothetical protein
VAVVLGGRALKVHRGEVGQRPQNLLQLSHVAQLSIVVGHAGPCLRCKLCMRQAEMLHYRQVTRWCCFQHPHQSPGFAWHPPVLTAGALGGVVMVQWPCSGHRTGGN